MYTAKWLAMSQEHQKEVLEELVRKIASQMSGVLDTRRQRNISTSVIVSSGDLSEQVGMFRIEDGGVGLFEVGLVSQRSGVDVNIVIGVLVTTLPSTGTSILAIRGVIVDGDGIGFYCAVNRDERGFLYRIGEMLRMEDGEDVGEVENSVIHPFLRGRYDERGNRKTPPAAAPTDVHGRGPSTRKMKHSESGSFWIEVRK